MPRYCQVGKLSHAWECDYSASLGLDHSFALDWVIAAGPFSPVSLQHIEIDALFDDKNEFDYVAMVQLLYPMVHPNGFEVISRVIHTFVNLDIIPDFILKSDACLCMLDLKN